MFIYFSSFLSVNLQIEFKIEDDIRKRRKRVGYDMTHSYNIPSKFNQQLCFDLFMVVEFSTNLPIYECKMDLLLVQ